MQETQSCRHSQVDLPDLAEAGLGSAATGSTALCCALTASQKQTQARRTLPAWKNSIIPQRLLFNNIYIYYFPKEEWTRITTANNRAVFGLFQQRSLHLLFAEYSFLCLTNLFKQLQWELPSLSLGQSQKALNESLKRKEITAIVKVQVTA